MSASSAKEGTTSGTGRNRAASSGGSAKGRGHARKGSMGSPGPTQFKKMNTMANLYQKFFGFEKGSLAVEVAGSRNLPVKVTGHKAAALYMELSLRNAAGETAKKLKLPAIMIPGMASTEVVWNQDVLFDVSDEEQELFLVLTSQKMLGKKAVGSATISMRRLGNGEVLDEWVVFKNAKGEPCGEVFVRSQYTSNRELNGFFQKAVAFEEEILQVLLDKNLVIVCTLCRVYASDELAKTLIRVFNHEQQALRLLIQLVYRELKIAKSKETLFRDDSMCTKSCRNYFMLIGTEYLKRVVAPLIHEVMQAPENYEVDPQRLGGDGSAARNLLRLRGMAQRFADAIFASTDFVPHNMRKFFDLALQLVRQVYPDADSLAMSNFFFLRWLCPLIVSPDGFGIVDSEPSPQARRALVLISKFLQSMANGVPFREVFLEPAVDFVQGSNQRQLAKFLAELSRATQEGPPDAERPPMTEQDLSIGLALVMSQVSRNSDRLESDIANDPRVKPGETLQQAQANMKTLLDIIRQNSPIQ